MISIPGYLLAEELCMTAGSRLYRARRLQGGEPVLLKLFDADKSGVEQSVRCRHEHEILLSLDLPPVKPVELIDQPECAAIVLQDFDGQPLEVALARQELNLQECLAVARQLAGILGKVHEAHIIHGDIRPANILVDAERRVALVDFSLAMRGSGETAEVAGGWSDRDWAYLSPEQTGRMNRTTDYRTDFYSLGVTLYRLFTGELPFVASDPVEWAHCHIARLPRPPHEVAPEVPPAVSDIVMKLLAKMAEARYQTAHGLQLDLAHCQAEWKASGQIEPFVLGTKDVSSHFNIPRKLYGRDAEAATLLAAFQRMTASGKPALAVVSGASGTGKSVLVHELYRPVVRGRGYFIAGKFGQYQRDIPYSALADACQDLVQQMLAEPEQRIASWRQQLQSELGAHGQLLIELIPQLELIIGPQPSVADLPPLEAQHHFQRVFRHFIALFETEKRPLVIFLDDMQWADTASVSLIEQLLVHPDTYRLMLVAAYRDNEVTPAHPFMLAIDKIGKLVVPVEVHLGSLHADALCQLLAETLHCGRAEAEPLAAVVLRKTGGNAFFVNQFLRTLHRDELLAFDPAARAWRWDAQRVQAAEVTANVVEWMSGQISRLPLALQEILCLAACLGNQFDLDVPAQIMQCNPLDIAAQLDVAVEQGFCLTRTDAGHGTSARRHSMYRWAHDRVQQAAYSLLAPHDRIRAHLQIGRTLLAATPMHRIAAGLFEIISHLNQAIELMASPEERRQLAELNLSAARHAKRATAFAAARNYAATGVALLSSAAWRDEYPLALALHRELIEATYLCLQGAEADALLDDVLARAHTDLERAQLLRLPLMFATMQQRDHVRATEVGLQALRLLGVDVPPGPEGWAAAIPGVFAGVEAALEGVEHDDLLNRPLLTDPTQLAINDLLTEVLAIARFAGPNLSSLLILHQVKLGLTHGHTANSAFGYSTFAIIVNLFRKDLDRAYRFAGLARKLAKQFNRPEIESKIDATMGLHLEFWGEHIATIIPRYKPALAIEIEYGNLQYAGYYYLALLGYRIAAGDPLDKVAEQLAEAVAFGLKSANYLVLHPLQRMDRLVAALRGQPASPSTPPTPSVDHVLGELGERADEPVRYEHLAELKRLVLFGDFDNARRLVARSSAPAMTTGLSVVYCMIENRFYHALVAAATCDMQNGVERDETVALLRAEEQEFAQWAQRCRANYAHFGMLLAAEAARLAGNHPQALCHYEEAIAAAVKADLPNIQGLAAERAASACEAQGSAVQVAAYLHLALTAYAAWGADAKVRQLDAYAGRFRHALLRVSAHREGPERLDFLSVVKASQAVSGEIVLEKLLDTLMRVVIENAGAQKGCLILHNAEGPFLAAEAYVKAQYVHVRVPREQNISATLLPESVLNYVRRSRDQVLLEDATETNRFSTDPYIRQQRPKSLLCLPILRRGDLTGALYLEHRLVTHAFTPDRLAVLRLLASQAAISLENAQLYTELKERESRIRRLVESNIIGVFFWNMDGRISDANDAFLKMTGYTRQDLWANNIRWADLTPPEYHALDEYALEEIRRSGTSTSFEKEYVRKDGSRFPILVGSALIEGSQDEGIGFVLDLTERKQAEAERAARKAAEAASQEKSAFLANMSHELRSPLSTMLGFGRLMERHAGLPTEVKEDLSIMLRNGEHLRTLINQVLDLAKIEAGRASIDNSDFAPQALLDELEDMFAFNAKDKGLLLQFRQHDVPRFIRADLLKLRQVLINLLSNALKFTDQGSVVLRTMDVSGPAGARLRFEVTDTGAGIGAEELKSLFNPFVQARAGQQAQEGTGLGLAISRNYVRLMGGEIRIESRPGGGTTVSFDIPVQLVGAEASAAPPGRLSRRVVSLMASEQPYRILVADDRFDARQLLLRLLAPLGFELREATNGQEAIEVWQAWRPHLIWMDMRMPVMDGREASRRIKVSPYGRDTIIIALTASSFEDERADILASGCDDFLRKPFEEGELFDLMQKHLGLSFIYQDDAAAVRDTRAQVDNASLATLPDDVRVSLERALIRLDSEAVATAIAEVPAPLAHALETLAHEFQYSKMLQLIQGGKHDRPAGHSDNE
ncbi:MAG: hypothetical protein V7642_4677 [Burkholderiales bacterium]